MSSPEVELTVTAIDNCIYRTAGAVLGYETIVPLLSPMQDEIDRLKSELALRGIHRASEPHHWN